MSVISSMGATRASDMLEIDYVRIYIIYEYIYKYEYEYIYIISSFNDRKTDLIKPVKHRLCGAVWRH